MALTPPTRTLLRNCSPLLSRISSPHTCTRDLIRSRDQIRSREFSAVPDKTSLSLEDRGNTISVVKAPLQFVKDQTELFADPEFFQTPVLMLHCQYTDFAVSLHSADKLDELDCLWSCFPCDLKIYGMKQRTEAKTVQLILVRAREAMKKYGVTKCRIAFKGYKSKTLLTALTYLENFPFEFVSVTDLTRKLGEESPVYTRPLPRYPVNKMPLMRCMTDGPDTAPKTLIEKFQRLNVMWVDVEQKGQGLTVKSTEAKASKRGFILKGVKRETKPEPKDLLAPIDPPS